jgi:hypothetical protein
VGTVTPYYADDLVTLYHGDCAELMPGLTADAVITDPPYGVGVVYGPSYDDARPDYWPWMRSCVEAMRAAAPVVAFTHRVAALRELTDWDWVAVWSKGSTFGPRVGNSPVVAGWEAVLLYGIHSLGVDGQALPDVLTIHPSPSENVTDGRIGREKWQLEQVRHPVPKPMGLYRRLVDALTVPGQLVLDPFAGTGTTVMAAKESGRRAIGIEIEERWCERAALRCSQEVLGLSA